MRRMLLVWLIVWLLILGGCVYPPEWGIDPEPTDVGLPPDVGPEPVLPFPGLPWNHPCNQPGGISDACFDTQQQEGEREGI